MTKTADEIECFLAFYRALIVILEQNEDDRSKLLVKSIQEGQARIERDNLSDSKKQRQVLAGLKQGYRELPQFISEGFFTPEAADQVRELIVRFNEDATP